MGKTRFGSVILASALFACGCGSSSSGTETGGSPGSGGTSSGGTTGTGGNATGGTTGTGGITGTGGGHTGGATGTGGSSATGGTTGTGGATSTGGSGGSAGSGTGGSSATGGATGTGGSATGGAAGGSAGGVTVQTASTHQTIEGFGLNTALSSAAPNWDTFYSTSGTGLRLSIVRVAMNSDGSLSGTLPPSSYNAKVIASPWTAPAADKDNNNTQKGGHLKTTSYDSWSTKIATFAHAHNVYAMAAANEPDFASCGASIGPP